MKLSEIATVQTVDATVDLIKNRCATILDAMQHASTASNFRALFRGEDANATPRVRKIWKDRRPLQLLPAAHDILHDVFIDAGLKATRSNSLFCSMSTSLAAEWGDLIVVFPFDGWTITVFDNLESMYLFNEITELKSYQLMREPIAPADRQNFEQEAQELLKKVGARSISTSSDLSSTFSKALYLDLLVTGEEYLSLPAYGGFTEQVLEKLGFSISAYKKRLP